MKKLKRFMPLWNLVKEEKGKLIIASILVFLAEITEIFTGYLNGRAVESITELALKSAILYLAIYLIIRIVFDTIISTISSSMFQRIESKLTRRLGFFRSTDQGP